LFRQTLETLLELKPVVVDGYDNAEQRFWSLNRAAAIQCEFRTIHNDVLQLIVDDRFLRSMREMLAAWLRNYATRLDV
jgi:hypothetical protein